ncbi:hypothetical protein BDC45DRAFT_567701 [Circinella umbellata]|nr:hypothetical protein BDC45DRAFT_567701 [Circinella umbellata]
MPPVQEQSLPEEHTPMSAIAANMLPSLKQSNSVIASNNANSVNVSPGLSTMTNFLAALVLKANDIKEDMAVGLDFLIASHFISAKHFSATYVDSLPSIKKEYKEATLVGTDELANGVNPSFKISSLGQILLSWLFLSEGGQAWP